MEPIATDVTRSVVCMFVCLSVRLSVCLSVCVLVIGVCCAKMAEPMEMPFEGLSHVGLPKRNYLYRDQ